MSATGAVSQVEELFRGHGVPELIELGATTRLDIASKQQGVRDLVKKHHRDLMDSADAIMTMEEHSSQVVQAVGSVCGSLDATFLSLETGGAGVGDEDLGRSTGPRAHSLEDIKEGGSGPSAVSVQVGRLTGLSAAVWSHLDAGQCLRAAEIFVSGEVSLVSLKESSAELAVGALPFLTSSFVPLKDTIVDKLVARLANPALGVDCVADALLAAVLLGHSTVPGLLGLLLDSRKASVQSIMMAQQIMVKAGSGVGEDGGGQPVKDTLAQVLALLITTVLQVNVLFLPAKATAGAQEEVQEGGGGGSLIDSHLAALHDSTAPTSDSTCITFCPPGCKTREALADSVVRPLARAWYQETTQISQSVSQQVLSTLSNLQELVELHAGLKENLSMLISQNSGISMSEEGGEGGEAPSVLPSSNMSSWESVAIQILGEGCGDAWASVFGTALQSCCMRIAEASLCTLPQQIQGHLSDCIGSVSELCQASGLAIEDEAGVNGALPPAASLWGSWQQSAQSPNNDATAVGGQSLVLKHRGHAFSCLCNTMDQLNIAFTLALPATTDDTDAVRQHNKAIWAMLMEHVNKTLISVCSWISINLTEPLRHALHRKVDEDITKGGGSTSATHSTYAGGTDEITGIFVVHVLRMYLNIIGDVFCSESPASDAEMNEHLRIDLPAVASAALKPCISAFESLLTTQATLLARFKATRLCQRFQLSLSNFDWLQSIGDASRKAAWSNVVVEEEQESGGADSETVELPVTPTPALASLIHGMCCYVHHVTGGVHHANLGSQSSVLAGSRGMTSPPSTNYTSISGAAPASPSRATSPGSWHRAEPSSSSSSFQAAPLHNCVLLVNLVIEYVASQCCAIYRSSNPLLSGMLGDKEQHDVDRSKVTDFLATQSIFDTLLIQRLFFQEDCAYFTSSQGFLEQSLSGQSLLSDVESHIDPIDYALFRPHIAKLMSTDHQRTALIFGTVFSYTAPVLSKPVLPYSSPPPKNGKAGSAAQSPAQALSTTVDTSKPSVLALAPVTTRFSLLPVSMADPAPGTSAAAQRSQPNAAARQNAPSKSSGLMSYFTAS